jgi:hypothetical protein
MSRDEDVYRNRKSIFSIVVISVLIAFTIGISIFLIITQKIIVDIDFSYFLSILVSMFALGLSVIFYFKASETSNRFYDNTYKFTHDISEKIGRMDERFGERLTHINDDLNKYFDFDSIRQIKKEIEKEKMDAVNISNSREELIKKLIEQLNISQEEKKKYLDKINKLFEEENNKKRNILVLENTMTKDFYCAESVIDQLVANDNLAIENWENHNLNVEPLEDGSKFQVIVYKDLIKLCCIVFRAYQNKYFIPRNDSVIQRLIRIGYLQPEKLY